ncbi:P-loop containing nucleoside triphosphate hydrolase protein [Mrakia frigida]|uniref:putative ATP-binding cassette family ATPase CAF16 n=1 Tax=Mrakia frigida TaxID=29902 RepID=UPI003FCBF6F7
MSAQLNNHPEDLLAIDVSHLDFAYNGEGALHDVELKVEQGERILVIGANGAGKSTLLRILAGKRLTASTNARLLGRDVFRSPPEGVTYLGTEWALNPVVRGDIVVSHFLDSVGGYRHKERRDRLLGILDVDLDWHMHEISDGERRRVQLVMGLMAPWDILLLDEVTVDLDVLVRGDLIDFLIEESNSRKATIVYCTHIFDGLAPFPTYVLHMQLGRTPKPPIPWSPSMPAETGTSLLKIALDWLREDRDLRKQREKDAGGKARGPQAETKDAKTFFERFDYSGGQPKR